jgi:site-specific recombinase XerD
MPAYAKSGEDRWLHPTYRKAYCFRYQNGMCYTVVNSKRQATGYEFIPKNKKVCMNILEARINEFINHLTPVSQVKTVKDLILQFHRDEVVKLNIKTQLNYKSLYKQFLNFNIPLTKVQEIRNNIIEVKNSLHLANNTIWKRMQRVRKIFEYAVDLEWMEKNPVSKAMVPLYKPKKVVTSSYQNIQLLIEYFVESNLSMSLMIEFAFITALRIQEIIDIEWTDFNDSILTVRGKGNRNRIIPLHSFPRALEILKELKAIKFREKPFSWRNQQTPAKNLRKAVLELSKKFPELDWNITFHVIRKTTINLWRNAGVPVEVRNLISGHSKDVEKGFYLSAPEIKYLEKELEILSIP